MTRLPVFALLGCVLSACSHPAPPSQEPPATAATASAEQQAGPATAPAQAEAQPTTQARKCLPVVSGCGCAERCGDGFQQADGSWGVIGPMGDSALEPVTLGRRCFDARGISYDEGSAPASAGLCIDVFLEPQVCGGECIPRTEFLRCALSDQGACGAVAD